MGANRSVGHVAPQPLHRPGARSLSQIALAQPQRAERQRDQIIEHPVGRERELELSRATWIRDVDGGGLGSSRPSPLRRFWSHYFRMLSRIASLHPNRRTPPPPPPPPPPRKKTKKELELEEKWEEEMVESVGGMEAWAVLGDEERREMRKAKWARELGGWDE